MNKRDVSVVVFIDKDKNILVQDRKGISKIGEGYGFFGGRIESGETPLKALKRELIEELDYAPKKLTYLGLFPYIVNMEGKYKGWIINQHVYTSNVTLELRNSKDKEGNGMIEMPFNKVLEGKGFPEGSTYFIKQLI